MFTIFHTFHRIHSRSKKTTPVNRLCKQSLGEPISWRRELCALPGLVSWMQAHFSSLIYTNLLHALQLATSALESNSPRCLIHLINQPSKCLNCLLKQNVFQTIHETYNTLSGHLSMKLFTEPLWITMPIASSTKVGRVWLPAVTPHTRAQQRFYIVNFV